VRLPIRVDPTEHPFLAINGSKPGVGKSTLARFLGVIAEGHMPSMVSVVSSAPRKFTRSVSSFQAKRYLPACT